MVNVRGVRKYKKRIVKKKIDFTTILGLQPALLSSLEHVFVVDLTSFSNKSCNKLIHQMLFGKIKDSEKEKVSIFVIMKSKFSPKCRECGIGERDSKLFLKDRFILAGDGRVILNLDPIDGSLHYRKELTQFIYQHNQNLVILSEDKQYGFKIIGSDVPDDDYDTIEYLKYFDMPHIFDKDSDEAHEDSQQEIQNKALRKAETWLQGRLDKQQQIHLPKTMRSLEKALEPFSNIHHPFPFKQILNILRDAGDITICDTCQTCIPKSTSKSNQFYFSYKTLTEEVSKQCQWMINHIIDEYCKTPLNQVPLSLSKLTSGSSAPSQSVKIQPSVISNHLLNNCNLFSIDTAPPNETDSFESLLDQFQQSTFITTPTPLTKATTTILTKPSKLKSFSSGRFTQLSGNTTPITTPSTTPKKSFSTLGLVSTTPSASPYKSTSNLSSSYYKSHSNDVKIKWRGSN